VVVPGQRFIALVLLLDGAVRQLGGAFALAAGGFGLRAVARRRLGPVVDLLLQRRLLGRIGRGGQIELGLLGGDDRRGAPDVLGLEEIPKIGGLDLVVQRRGLCALAERLGEGKKQRQHRDQQRDLFVEALVLLMAVTVAMLVMLHLVLGLMLDRVYAVAHAAPPSID